MVRLPPVLLRRGRLDRSLTALFLAIQAIVLVNAVRHEPGIGYDALNHLRYIEAFSSFSLPTPDQTSEFFSPPLPYLMPAALRHYGVSLWGAAKGAQLLNAAYSVLLGLMVLSICEELRRGDRSLKILSLGLLGILPVYYKSFAFVRGEPLLAALAVFVVHRSMRIAAPGGLTGQNGVLLGLGLGLMVLSRQWGFLLVPAVIAYFALHMRHGTTSRPRTAALLASALLLGALVGGWFYVALGARQGTPLAFNRARQEGAGPGLRPASYYLGTGGGALFTAPTRIAFSDQLFPILYSETWGDYWCYFLLEARDRRAGRLIAGPDLEKALSRVDRPESLETNYASMSGYLGRVNLVALLPTALMLGGFMLGGASFLAFLRRPADAEVAGRALLFLGVACTLAGYAWFLAGYSTPGKADTVKATYLLQIFPLLAILTADLLARLERRSMRLARAAAAALALCALHNLPVLLTRMTL